MAIVIFTALKRVLGSHGTARTSREGEGDRSASLSAHDVCMASCRVPLQDIKSSAKREDRRKVTGSDAKKRETRFF
jgi:hypothetical protein